MVDGSQLTHRRLEHSLSQQITGLYLAQLGHQPNSVSCHLIDKTLTIIVEDSITLPEQILNSSGQADLAKQVRYNIQKAIEAHIKSVIEEMYATTVIDLFSNSAFDTGRTNIVAVLATVPEIVTKQQTGLAQDIDG